MAKKNIYTNLIQFPKTSKELPPLDKQKKFSNLPSTTQIFNLLQGCIQKTSKNIIAHTISVRKTSFKNLSRPKQNLSPFFNKKQAKINITSIQKNYICNSSNKSIMLNPIISSLPNIPSNKNIKKYKDNHFSTNSQYIKSNQTFLIQKKSIKVLRRGHNKQMTALS